MLVHFSDLISDIQSEKWIREMNEDYDLTYPSKKLVEEG